MYPMDVCYFSLLLLVIVCGTSAADSTNPLSWSEWSLCSVTCGSGRRMRQQGNGGNIEYIDCDTFGCPIDGRFSYWSEWGLCSRKCGMGTSFRLRTCDSPEPAYGGRECIGEVDETRVCGNHCPGKFKYGKWGECTKTCGGGTKTREAVCPEGYTCHGDPEVTSTCDKKKCPPACTYSNNYKVFADDKEIAIRRDQEKAVLTKLGKEFKVEFEFKLGDKSTIRGKDQSIFHMKALSRRRYGRKHPLVYIRDKKINVCVAIKRARNKGDGCFKGEESVVSGKWYKVDVTQLKFESGYVMKIDVREGKKSPILHISRKNSDAEEFHDVRVMVSDEQMEPVRNSFIKNLEISGSCPGEKPKPRQ